MRKFFVSLSMFIVGVVPVSALPPAAEGYTLVWSDEFDGTSLDTVNNWRHDTGMVYATEQESYHRANVAVENGNLVIWCRYNPNGTPSGKDAATAKYTSGRIDTHDKKIFTYGYFEVRMISPVGQVSGPGLWSAVWLLGNSIHHGVGWPTCGEMEIYEQRPSNAIVTASQPQPVPATIGDNEFLATCHYGINGGPSYHSCQRNYPTCLCDGYHKYGLLWDSTHVEYYFDDTLYWGPDFPIVNGTNFGTPSITQSANWDAFHSPFYWIIQVIIGSAYQGQNINNAIFPTKMLVDYVRVFQKCCCCVSVAGKDVRRQTLRSFDLVNPATALLTVYDLSGKLVADYSGRVKLMKKGDNALKIVPSALSNGAYVIRLMDNGVPASRILVTTR
jgi:beta-glucanase (GH16 family)